MVILFESKSCIKKFHRKIKIYNDKVFPTYRFAFKPWKFFVNDLFERFIWFEKNACKDTF